MALDFVRRTYYWLPRVGGGLSGTYEGVAAGDYAVYITDTGNLPDHYKPWPLPSWMPRKVLICGFMAAYAGDPYGDVGQATSDVELWVDPGGHYFNSAHGAEVGADMTRMVSLLCAFSSKTWQVWQRDLVVPVPWDRDAGDKLTIEWAMGTMAYWTVVAIDFLVPAPFQPTAMGGGY